MKDIKKAQLAYDNQEPETEKYDVYCHVREEYFNVIDRGCFTVTLESENGVVIDVSVDEFNGMEYLK